MKERYETLELEVVNFQAEDMILMSGMDNDGDTGEWGEEDLG